MFNNNLKVILKSLLDKVGLKINLVKNLWYLDSFYLLKKLSTNKSPVIFDIGASDGSSIIDFKKLFPDSKIFSFEPFPGSYQNLAAVSQQFKGSWHFEMALSDQDGLINFFVNKSKATNSIFSPKTTNSFIDAHAIFEKKIQVKSKMLDTFLEENRILEIDILKIDVQGGELKVFQGAKKTLENKLIKIIYTEIWFLEGYDRQPLFHDIASYLASYGYFPFGIYNMHYRNDGHFLWGDAIFYLK